MTYHFSSDTVKINKRTAIAKAQKVIADAREYLEVEGEEPAYYDWHRRTIEANRKAIQEILDSPDTNWN